MGAGKELKDRKKTDDASGPQTSSSNFIPKPTLNKDQ